MSSADKRSVHTDALATLGTIIGPNEGRDAIHLAVEPIQAGERLYPNQDVGIGEDGKAYADRSKVPLLLGKVDPFLKEQTVFPDQWFWLVIYPRQITSLRHVWEHPYIVSKAADAYVSEPASEAGFGEPVRVVADDSEKAKSRQWMQDWIGQYTRYYGGGAFTVEEALEAGRDYVRHGNYWVDGGTFEGEYVPDEYWDHFEVLTGIKVPQSDRHSFFSCSC